MNTKLDLSLIVVSFNTARLTLDCLKSVYQSLKGTKLTYEVIVVDNGSGDKTVNKISKNFPQTKIIQNEKNLGFGKANNQGVLSARGEVILLLNSDIKVIEGSLEKMYRQFKKSSTSIIAGGKLFNPDGSAQPSAGPAYTIPNIILALFFKGDYLNLTRYSPDTDREVDWVMGACMMIEKTTYEQVGGFDESIFMYMEEIDFLHRAKKAGIKVMFYSQPKFYHLGAGSSQGQTHPIVNVFGGLIYFYTKHHSKAKLTLLRIILLLKSVLGICLFTILNNKSRRIIYFEAIKIIF